MHAQSTFFHQGFDLFDDLDTYMKKVAAQVGICCVLCNQLCNCDTDENIQTNDKIQSVSQLLFNPSWAH